MKDIKTSMILYQGEQYETDDLEKQKTLYQRCY